VISTKPKPFRGFTGFLVRLALNNASFVSVRDAYSYAVIKLTGVCSRVIIEEGLAFRLSVPDMTECRDLAAKYGLLEGRILGINLRTLDGDTNNAVVECVIKLVGDLVVVIPRWSSYPSASAASRVGSSIMI